MPVGVPVATVALNGARNAGILAAQIIGASDKAVGRKLDKFKNGLKNKVEKGAKELEKKGWKAAE
jgi:5-(carboxyamino)imidazole ribonucleotide mutase